MASQYDAFRYISRMHAMNADMYCRMETLLLELGLPVGCAIRANASLNWDEFPWNSPVRGEAERAMRESRAACDAALLAHPLFKEWAAFIDGNKLALTTLAPVSEYAVVTRARGAWDAMMDGRIESTRNSEDEKGGR